MTEPVRQTNEVIQILESNPLFSGLSASSLKALAHASRVMREMAGEMIFLRSDPPEAAYIVHTGSVQILLSSPDGRQLVINEMHPGDCFGELALVTGLPRSANAVAGENCELLLIPRHAFLEALENEPLLARRLLRTTALRLSSSSEFESGLAFLDAQTRIARLLLDLNRKSNGGRVNISQEELADRAGLIRQTVAKTLGQWRRNGWIKTGRSRIEVVDCRALEQLLRDWVE
jgi:CRP/FNR family transcriptional regulator, cyclic AMP receptor protein